MKSDDDIKAGLHRRNEWESAVGGPALDIAALREMVGVHTHWNKLLRDATSLRPIFCTQVDRTIWDLATPAGDEIEFALDQGTIEHEDLTEPISEIEMELKVGAPENIFGYALQMLDAIPMSIENLSKAERGYALCMPQESPAPVKAGKIKLNKNMSVEKGFVAIASDCMAQIQGNETAVIMAKAPESLHQMRVGVRRLRSALGLFKDLAPLPHELQDDLDWLSSQLGPARDWDVLSQSTLAVVDDAVPDGAGVTQLQQAAADIAAIKREQAAIAVQSSRYAHLMLGLAGWLQGTAWRNTISKSKRGKMDQALPRFARNCLKHDQRRLLWRGRQLKYADPATRHKVRIAAKKTRYATEFFQSLYVPKSVAAYVDTLSALQDELGWLNDVRVADELLHALGNERQDLATDIGFARGYLTSNAQQQDRRLRELWTRFEPMKLPVARH